MSTEFVFADPALEALRKKYFPRIPWTAEGPVRRRYRALAQGRSVAQALEELALAEGFIGPGRRAVTGDGERCLAAYRTGENEGTLVFGLGPEAVWCDLTLWEPEEDGWQTLTVRSEEAENLIALAHSLGAVQFRKM